MGPESTGKTTLASALAKHYDTIWIPEYSREYVEKLHIRYTMDDILHCAHKQLESEQLSASRANKILFTDTELINCSVWLKDVFNAEEEWIQNSILENEYDLYLLLNYDLPFVNDPVRENQHRRNYFFDWYKRELENRGFKFKVISGFGQERISNAINEIDSFVKTSGSGVSFL
jgi:NadR type nicotinamide-nucleotide adenylyltransferase